MESSKIGDIPGLLALFLEISERFGKNTPAIAAFTEVAKQRMPNMFGIGRADEQLFESIRQLVPKPKRVFLDLVISNMRDYEENIFRITVTGMSYGSETTNEPVKNPAKGAPMTTKKTVSWEFTENDLRVKYLEDIADEVANLAVSSTEKLAAKQVVKAMRSRRLITRSPAAKKALKLWADTTKWTKKEILDLFGVDNFSDITPDMVAKEINTLANRIPERRDADLNPGFWVSAFKNQPVATVLSVIVIIMSMAVVIAKY